MDYCQPHQLQFECHHEKLYILNGDVFSEINFQKLYEHHITQKKLITISLKEISDVSGYGVVKIKNHVNIRHRLIFNKKTCNYPK